MFNRDRWTEIFETIGKNKLRTFLSGFTVSLGIFIFIILFGLGNGLKNTFQEFYLKLLAFKGMFKDSSKSLISLIAN